MNKLYTFGASALAVATIGAAGLAFSSTASAATTKPNPTERHEKRVERTARIDERLDAAVKAGTITSAQKDSLLKEMASLRDQERASFKKDATKAERQATHDQYRQKLADWAKQNGIDLSKLLPAKPVHK